MLIVEPTTSVHRLRMPEAACAVSRQHLGGGRAFRKHPSGIKRGQTSCVRLQNSEPRCARSHGSSVQVCLINLSLLQLIV